MNDPNLKHKFLLRYKKESVPGNTTHKILCDFEIQANHLNPGWIKRFSDYFEKKRTCRIMHFAVPADHRMIIIENEKETSN